MIICRLPSCAVALILGLAFLGCATKPSAPAVPPPHLDVFIPAEPLPVVGRTRSGQEIRLGGFSGLVFLGRQDNKLRFMTHTDRGPNGEAEGRRRPFALPTFSPRWVILEADETTHQYRVIEQITLTNRKGKPLNGLPPKGKNQEIPIDLRQRSLEPSADGIDPEAIASDGEGGYWMGEEYGPSLIHFDGRGREIERLSPGKGLPPIYAERELNHGFEGIALLNGKLYGFLQSPLASEPLRSRVVEVDLQSRQTREFFYYFDSRKSDKIGDAAVTPDGHLAVIERDGRAGPKSRKKIYRVIPGEPGQIMRKELIANLTRLGFPFEKAEGLAFLGDGRWAVIQDNDFGIDGDAEPRWGRVTLKDEVPQLFIYHP